MCEHTGLSLALRSKSAFPCADALGTTTTRDLEHIAALVASATETSSADQKKKETYSNKLPYRTELKQTDCTIMCVVQRPFHREITRQVYAAREEQQIISNQPHTQEKLIHTMKSHSPQHAKPQTKTETVNAHWAYRDACESPHRGHRHRMVLPLAVHGHRDQLRHRDQSHQGRLSHLQCSQQK